MSIECRKDNNIPTIKDWLITILILSIPVVNIIMLIIWSLKDEENLRARANYCKAQLIIMAISIVILLAFGIISVLVGISWS